MFSLNYVSGFIQFFNYYEEIHDGIRDLLISTIHQSLFLMIFGVGVNIVNPPVIDLSQILIFIMFVHMMVDVILTSVLKMCYK